MSTARWVVDTGPLTHFARAGWLGVLRLLAPGNTILIPETVEREIRAAVGSHSWLTTILSNEWIETVPLTLDEEVLAFSRYAQRLVGDDGRNLGECGVLALAEVHRHVAVIDDSAGAKAGRAAGVEIRRTLGLLCDAVQEGHLPLATVSAIADSLIETDYRLPLLPGGFAHWATASGRITIT